MILKIGLIGMTAVFLTMPFKKEKGEFALLMGIAVSVLIFIVSISKIQGIVDFISGIISKIPVDKGCITAIFKMLGITYIADFSSSVCKEAGYATIGNQIELFAKLSIIALSIPELIYLVNTLENFLTVSSFL